MRLFKRIYITGIDPKNWETLEALISQCELSESERPKNTANDRITAHYRRAIGDDAIHVEASRGWCSWGF